MASASKPVRGYMPPQGDEETLFVKRIADFVRIVQSSGKPRCTLFCTDREQELADAQMRALQHPSFAWQGGYDGAERKMLCVLAEDSDEPNFDCQSIFITVPRGADALTHRDYLGSLMGLQIKRGYIGDILPSENGATVFVTGKCADVIVNEISQIGRCVAKAELAIFAPNIIRNQEQTQQTATVASLRLDALLAAMLHISRADAATLIASKAVAINHMEETRIHSTIYEDDVFTVRGYGKYKLCNIGNKSRKDRIFVSFVQY